MTWHYPKLLFGGPLNQVQLQLPLISVVEEYKVVTCRVTLSLRDSSDDLAIPVSQKIRGHKHATTRTHTHNSEFPVCLTLMFLGYGRKLEHLEIK